MNKFWLFLYAALFSLSASAGLLDRLTNNNTPQFLPVDQAFPLATLVEGNSLTASWTSHQHYYLYKHRIFLTQGETVREPVYLSLPGIEKDDQAFGLVTAFYGPLEARFDLTGLQAGEIELHHQGCADAGLCYPPQTKVLTLTAANVTAASEQSTSEAPSTAPASNTSDSWFAGRSTLTILGIFFALGLGLTFTPCVLPMVPILTSVVLGQGTQSAKRGFYLSSLYVIGMALAYAAAGVAIGLLGAGANIQAWLQTPWVLVLFAALFIFLALAMFGLYELQLPATLRNRLDALSRQQQGGKGLSVFLMGALSALIVSPCISAPLAAALVYISTTGDALLGGLALLALGLGMGTPLIVLGTSGASLLPKAGAWMNQVKIFFGVLLLAVAIWLLERILPAGVGLLLWAWLAIVYAVVLGAFEPATKHSQRLVKGIAWVLLSYGILAFAGVLMGNNQPFQPLAERTVVGKTESAHAVFFTTTQVSELQKQIDNAAGLVMLDLYADWCISCKIMDKAIFQQADVQRQLNQVRWLQLDLTANNAEQRAFLQQHGIFGPPTILFFQDGQEVPNSRLVGELSKAEFMEKVRPLLP